MGSAPCSQAGHVLAVTTNETPKNVFMKLILLSSFCILWEGRDCNHAEFVSSHVPAFKIWGLQMRILKSKGCSGAWAANKCFTSQCPDPGPSPPDPSGEERALPSNGYKLQGPFTVKRPPGWRISMDTANCFGSSEGIWIITIHLFTSKSFKHATCDPDFHVIPYQR